MNDSAAERPEPGDGELIAAWQRGSEAALETLFERYRRPLFAYFNRMLGGDWMSADDLFQELWIKLLRKLPDYEEQGRFANWLFRVAHNLVLEHFRRQQSRAKIGAPTADGELPETAAEKRDDPAGETAAHELEAQLEAALRKVTPEQREVFHLRQSGLSFREIAELQQCPLNTALGRMHTVMLILKKELKTE